MTTASARKSFWEKRPSTLPLKQRSSSLGTARSSIRCSILRREPFRGPADRRVLGEVAGYFDGRALDAIVNEFRLQVRVQGDHNLHFSALTAAAELLTQLVRVHDG